MRSHARHFLPYRLCLVVIILSEFAATNPIRAQTSPASTAQIESRSDNPEETPLPSLSIDLESHHPAKVIFDFDSDLEKGFNLPSVLSTALGCQLQEMNLSREDEDQSTSLSAQCDIPVRQSLLTHTGTIDLHSISDIQKAKPSFTIFLTLSVPKSDTVHCDPLPQKLLQDSDKTTCLYSFEDPTHTPAALRFEFGYRRSHVVRLMGVLGFLLLIPITLTFWFRRRASDVSDEAKTAVSFAYRRFLVWTALFGALVWWATVDLLHGDQFAAFLLPSWEWIDAFAAAIVPWVVIWIPPLFVYFLCLALSKPMQTLRGTKYTRKQILSRSFWAVGRLVLPLFFICLGIVELFHSPRLFVLLIALGIVAGKFANRAFVQAYGVELHALTSGELRDRAFAIADKAKTRLNQLYVIPAEHMRMANAFAHVAHNVLLTDYLVKNMSKSEVDAVVAHEIAHLQNRHIRRRMTVTLIAVLAFAFAAGFLEYWLPRGLPNGPIFYAVVVLALLFVSRRNEFSADAGSVKLTGDAEAMITALARLTRLNTVPMQWGRFDEKLLTHPRHHGESSGLQN
jgi:Zn-dependent protease with chaperone function